MIKKLGIIVTLLKEKFKIVENVDDHVASIKSHSNKLVLIGFTNENR